MIFLRLEKNIENIEIINSFYFVSYANASSVLQKSEYLAGAG
jgi:hypothetical protein